LKIILYTVVAFVGSIVFAGILTYSFSTTEGTVLSASKSEVLGTPYAGYRGGANMYDGGMRQVSNVRYLYTVNGNTYLGSLEEFWILSSSKESYWPDRQITVYYSPFNAKIAVLHQGPDMLLILFSLTIILSWLGLKLIIRAAIENV